jgi:hypothetical protein
MECGEGSGAKEAVLERQHQYSQGRRLQPCDVVMRPAYLLSVHAGTRGDDIYQHLNEAHGGM